MNRISRSTRLLSVAVILGFFLLSVPGCVSSSTYKAAKKEAEDLRHELQQERLKVVAVEKMHAQRIKQMEDLASRFGSSVQRLEDVAKNWSDLRSELVRLRINRELERQKAGGGIGIVLDNDSLNAPSGR
jgi:TolA-binding protein